MIPGSRTRAELPAPISSSAIVSSNSPLFPSRCCNKARNAAWLRSLSVIRRWRACTAKVLEILREDSNITYGTNTEECAGGGGKGGENERMSAMTYMI